MLTSKMTKRLEEERLAPLPLDDAAKAASPDLAAFAVRYRLCPRSDCVKLPLAGRGVALLARSLGDLGEPNVF